MFPRTKSEWLVFSLIFALALGWFVAVSAFGPDLFRMIDAILPRE